MAGGVWTAGGGQRLGWVVAAALLAAAFGALFAVTAYGVGPLALPAALVALAAGAIALARPAWGIAAALLATPLEFVALPLPSGALSPSEALFVLTALGWLGRALLGRGAVVLPSTRDAPIIVLLLTFLAGLWIARDAVEVFRVSALWVAFYFVYLQARSASPSEMRVLVASFAIAAGVLGAIGSFNYITSGNTNLLAGGLTTGDRAEGTFVDPNYYASLLLLAVIPAVALVLAHPRRQAFLVPAIVLAVGGLVFSLSRGGLLGLAVGLLALALIWKRARVAALVVILVVGAASMLSANPFSGVDEFGSVEQRLGTLNASLIVTDRRPEIWRTAIDVTQEHPLVGVGVKHFRFAASERGLTERGVPVDNVHNIPLNFAAENGILGVVAFLLFLAQLALRGVRASTSSDPMLRALAAGLVAALAGFLLQGLTQSQLRVNVIAGAFFVAAGLLTAIADRTPVRGPPEAAA